MSIVEAVRVVNDVISLTRAVINWVGDAGELGLCVEGEALILKKVRASRLSKITGRASEDESPQ